MTRWRTGPVAVTGADGHVGREVRARLSRYANPVRPLVRADDWEAGLEDVETVIHLAGTLRPRRPDGYGVANVGTTVRMLNALGTATRRLVFLSYVGADPASSNEYLRSKAEAEDLIVRTQIPSVVFRSTYVFGTTGNPGPSFASYRPDRGKSVSVLGDGSQLVAPIQVGDLSELLVRAALDERAPTGTFEVGGPETLTIDEFVRFLNPPGTKIRHVPDALARVLGRVIPGLTPALVDVLLADATAFDPFAAAGRFGVTLHYPEEVLASVREVRA